MRAREVLLLAAATIALAARAALPAPGAPGAPADPRYCGEPARAADGSIKRSAAERARFARIFPCPATLKPVTSCAHWQIDHVLPLADGGCDQALNMQWLPDAIKTCAASTCKDRWERIYHAIPRRPVPSPASAHPHATPHRRLQPWTPRGQHDASI